MMVFFDLPADISLTVLREWVNSIRVLTRLDSACAPSVRAEFLDLVRDESFTWPAPAVFREIMDLTGVVLWINTRMLRFESLDMDASAVLALTEGVNPVCLELRYPF